MELRDALRSAADELQVAFTSTRNVQSRISHVLPFCVFTLHQACFRSRTRQLIIFVDELKRKKTLWTLLLRPYCKY
jgi:hypothetical protein